MHLPANVGLWSGFCAQHLKTTSLTDVITSTADMSGRCPSFTASIICRSFAAESTLHQDNEANEQQPVINKHHSAERLSYQS